MKLIALHGYVGAGKNAVGDILEKEHGFKQFSFAKALKDCVMVLDPFITTNDEVILRLSDLIRLDGTLDIVKLQYKEVRRLLQVMGTEVGRDIIGKNVWVDIVRNQLLAEAELNFSEKSEINAVITDMRFPNEYAMVRSLNGECWRINRPNHGPINNHASETSLSGFDFDYVIHNNHTLHELGNVVQDIVDGKVIPTNEKYEHATEFMSDYEKRFEEGFRNKPDSSR